MRCFLKSVLSAATQSFRKRNSGIYNGLIAADQDLVPAAVIQRAGGVRVTNIIVAVFAVEIQLYIAVVHGNGVLAVQGGINGAEIPEFQIKAAVPEGAGFALHITVENGERTELCLIGFGKLLQF